MGPQLGSFWRKFFFHSQYFIRNHLEPLYQISTFYDHFRKTDVDNPIGFFRRKFFQILYQNLVSEAIRHIDTKFQPSATILKFCLMGPHPPNWPPPIPLWTNFAHLRTRLDILGVLNVCQISSRSDKFCGRNRQTDGQTNRRT